MSIHSVGFSKKMLPTISIEDVKEKQDSQDMLLHKNLNRGRSEGTQLYYHTRISKISKR